MLNRLGLVLHIIIETPAAISFLLPVEGQLPGASTEAKLIMQNLGGALLTTNVVSAIFVLRSDFDDLSRLVALALATYHVWPLRRAYVRLTGGTAANKVQRKTLGGPQVHLFVHTLCFAALVLTGISSSR